MSDTATAPQPSQAIATRAARIESGIDRSIAREMPVSATMGGMAFSNMEQVMNFAKMMAISSVAIPKHLRDNVGACLAVAIQAVEWRMSPFAVANKTYVVNDRISFESQLIHAVVEQRAPLTSRLRHRFTGEGDQRRCIVWATVKGEAEPLEFQSAPIGQIQPKNSPLWKTKPDLQLYYNASRDWARMYFPDVILGVYAEDELDKSDGISTPETKSLNAKLKGQQTKVTALPEAGVQIITEEPQDIPETSDNPPEPEEINQPAPLAVPRMDRKAFDAACVEVAERGSGRIPKSVTLNMVKYFVVGKAASGANFDKLSDEDRQEFLSALAEDRVDRESGKVLEESQV